MRQQERGGGSALKGAEGKVKMLEWTGSKCPYASKWVEKLAFSFSATPLYLTIRIQQTEPWGRNKLKQDTRSLLDGLTEVFEEAVLLG